jgi:hypothetical protein
MSVLAELQRRAEELAKLGRETSDDRLRNILICLSQEFRQEAEQTVAADEPRGRLSDFVPRYDETQLGGPAPYLDHVTRSLNPLCEP